MKNMDFKLALEAVNSLEDVFLKGNASCTTINHMAPEIFMLTTFIQHGKWQFKDDTLADEQELLNAAQNYLDV